VPVERGGKKAAGSRLPPGSFAYRKKGKKGEEGRSRRRRAHPIQLLHRPHSTHFSVERERGEADPHLFHHIGKRKNAATNAFAETQGSWLMMPGRGDIVREKKKKKRKRGKSPWMCSTFRTKKRKKKKRGKLGNFVRQATATGDPREKKEKRRGNTFDPHPQKEERKGRRKSSANRRGRGQSHRPVSRRICRDGSRNFGEGEEKEKGERFD